MNMQQLFVNNTNESDAQGLAPWIFVYAHMNVYIYMCTYYTYIYKYMNMQQCGINNANERQPNEFNCWMRKVLLYMFM